MYATGRIVTALQVELVGGGRGDDGGQVGDEGGQREHAVDHAPRPVVADQQCCPFSPLSLALFSLYLGPGLDTLHIA